MTRGLIQAGKRALEAGQIDRARRFFVKAVKTNPREEEAWIYLSRVVEERYKRADCLRRALALNPDNVETRRELSTLFEDKLPGKLTPQQRAAILHQGSPLLIIAGPGSGKTEVIAWRITHMVHSGLADPERVLAVTFTEKAALGLKDRIQSNLPEVNAELMHISTIHIMSHEPCEGSERNE